MQLLHSDVVSPRIGKKWWARALLLAALGSFAAIGVVSGILKSSKRGSTVIEVGGVSITKGDYNRLYQSEVAYMRQLMGKTFDEADMVRLGLQSNVLRELENQALSINFAHDLGLRVGHSVIYDAIRENPSFFGDNEVFNQERFYSVLRSNNYTESSYVSKVRDAMIQNNLMSLVSKQEFPLGYISEVLHRYRLQNRVVDLVSFDVGSISDSRDFTDEEISAYYEKHSADYYSPEKRKLRYMTIGAKDVSSAIEVGEEELAKALDDRVEAEKTIERRDVVNAVFNDYGSASKFYDSISKRRISNDGFTAAAKLVTDNVVTIEAMERSAVTAGFGDAVFALEKSGDISSPFHTQFGWHVVQLRNSYNHTAESLRKLVRDSLAEDKINEALYGMIANIEEDHKAGKQMSDIARDRKLLVFETGYFSVVNDEVVGNYPSSIPDFMARASISKTKNDKSDFMYDSMTGQYLVFEVLDVQSGLLRPLGAVRDSIVAELRHSFRMDKLRKMAEKAREDAILSADCKSRSASIISAGGKYLRSRSVYRPSVAQRMDLAVDNDYPRALLDQIFALNNSGEITDIISDGSSKFVFAIFNSVQDPVDNNDYHAQSIKSELSNLYKDSLYRGMTEHLRGRYKVRRYTENVTE